jgi:hypothetical protein
LTPAITRGRQLNLKWPSRENFKLSRPTVSTLSTTRSS